VRGGSAVDGDGGALTLTGRDAVGTNRNGGAVTITGGNATGSGTNGNIILTPQNGDVRFNKALVALGGGAAPTFGTIGGSGPATAAQNTWMRWLDSAGVAMWIPVWK
jgi:hypothetical protein